MEPVFQINPQLDIPIYQQLVDMIRAGVKKGTLTPGQQLPTVQELANQLSIARGTIKRAYDELEHLGFLEKIQGRGTFICYRQSDAGSRKERAVASIDELLDKLEDMGFSTKEISIFLDLKQRERAQKQFAIRVAVLECNPENLSQMTGQLRSISGIELFSYLLGGIEDYPYKLDEDVDLVITTAEHAAFVESILSDPRKLIRIALRLTEDTLSGIVRLNLGESVGILTHSTRFGGLLSRTCSQYAAQAALTQPSTFSEIVDVDEFLSNKDAVLVPKDYEKYCHQLVAQKLEQFSKTGKLISCEYRLDEGSCLYLEEKLRQMRREKEM